ncbi:LysM peptidoglycan-binding domain-containing protein [Oceanobacillus alkalisoli]|uniref:LysM peptidoglycan-binding domain-containing protein n=1 Tax=Oceanobacillus alkalisoli TaxID=2925113 RepID=UPI001EF00D96|nr:SafA/ExsA family spore coat assembly protein [Oceanobacillus alkalisoli]MCF3941878.1 SafA/ExsA family spore coat assembly protein [Oceanobacillus alkalisoli]MCG5104253.1 SafA/ExsA family spore coat assembly protein [Oceanobacillus alkalisoli]
MKIHIVQKGDTLWEIAKKYHVDFEELKELNSHLASPDMIMPGMKIRIPTHSKKITQGEKTKTLPKEELKHVPAPKKEVQVEKKPAAELPKMPTFPFEPEKMLPTLEEKHKEYPIEILPELPKTSKKKEKPKAKEQVKPKQQPKQEKQDMPETQPMQPPMPMHPPMQQPMMPPVDQPCFAQPPMMPMFTYPCQGYMPMPHVPSNCGFGCGGGHGYHHPFHHGWQAPIFMPMQSQPQPQVFPNMMHQQQFQAPQEEMYQSVDPNMMQMYPEPTAGLRNEELELYPTPEEKETDHKPIEVEEE